MDKLELSLTDREVARVANETAERRNVKILAIELEDGKIITGKESELLSATSAELE